MTARLAQIFRHPIKGHGREAIASVRLLAGECLPFDRHWAVAHDAARLVPGWNSCVNFARGAKAPALMAITARLDEATLAVTLAHPARGEICFHPDLPADLPGFLDWVAPLNPPDRARPASIQRAGRGMTDTDFPSVSIMSLDTLRAFETRMGRALSVHRWRGNLWIEGAAPWAEFDWIGRRIRIGGAVLRIDERITRCRSTMADPETGRIDVDTLTGLQSAYGHQDFGVNATVIAGGMLGLGDGWEVL